MEFIAFAISIPGATVLLALWVWWGMTRRRRFLRRLQAHACAICGTSFADALAEDAGRPGPADLAGLDRFQRRFAARVVVCLECGSRNVCTRDAIPFKGLPLRE